MLILTEQKINDILKVLCKKQGLSMRKQFALLLTLVMLLALCACGQKKMETVPSPPSPTETYIPPDNDPLPVNPEPAIENGYEDLENLEEELDDGAQDCQEMFGNPYIGLAVEKMEFPDLQENIRLTEMFSSYGKSEGKTCMVPVPDWEAYENASGRDYPLIARKYEYNFGDYNPSRMFDMAAEEREFVGFKLFESYVTEGDFLYDITAYCDIALDDFWDSDEYKEQLCSNIRGNLNNPGRDKSSSQVLRGTVGTSMGGGTFGGSYIGSYDLGIMHPDEMEMSSSTNIYISPEDQMGLNIQVTMRGSLSWADPNKDTPIPTGGPEEAFLRKHVEEMENAIWSIYGLQAESELIRTAPELTV